MPKKPKFRLTKLFRSKHGLSEAISVLIIVVATVLLSTVVVLLAVNVTTSQVQKEKLYIATSHVWYVNSTTSIASLGVTNVGPTSIVLNKIVVNGVQCQWSGTTNYVVYCDVDGSLPGDLQYTSSISNVQNTTIPISGQPFVFTPASEGLTIKSGYSIAFYMIIPNSIEVYDVSMPVDIVITTTQAAYCAETLVQST